MTPRTLLYLIISVMVLGACIAAPFFPEAATPFDLQLDRVQRVAVIQPSALGTPLPAGLQAGDKLYFQDMRPATRLLLLMGKANPPVDTVVDLDVRRDDGLHTLSASYMPAPFLRGDTDDMVIEVAGFALALLTAALGLLLMWRGHSRATLGVAIWCFGSVAQYVTALLPLPMPYGKLLSTLGTLAFSVGTLVGLYLVADDLTASARARNRRTITAVALTVIVLGYTAAMVSLSLWTYERGTAVDAISYIVPVHFAGFLLSFGVMVAAYRHCTPVNQARIRWVMVGLLGMLLTYALSITAGRLGIAASAVNVAATVLRAASLMGFAYAVLKHRLVALELVLNRALVYGLIMSALVGMFAAMLSFLEHETLTSRTNRVVALLIPLVLGMGLASVRRGVEKYVGRFLFRRRRLAEDALSQFARTCAYMEDADKLLDLTATELYRHARPQAMAIYLSGPEHTGAMRVRKHGDERFPEHLDANDLAFLRLKAGDMEVDLHELGSTLGQDGFVYALVLRNEVLGFIVMGPRPAESYSEDERRLFALVAHQVGVALHALRLVEQERLLRELIQVSPDKLVAMQDKARKLVGA
ncbi:MAG TPA: GAF domain-containing protein, partial [Gammaproteobacteria bacterium]